MGAAQRSRRRHLKQVDRQSSTTINPRLTEVDPMAASRSRSRLVRLAAQAGILRGTHNMRNLNLQNPQNLILKVLKVPSWSVRLHLASRRAALQSGCATSSTGCWSGAGSSMATGRPPDASTATSSAGTSLATATSPRSVCSWTGQDSSSKRGAAARGVYGLVLSRLLLPEMAEARRPRLLVDGMLEEV